MNRKFDIIDGNRIQREKEIVESLFTGQFDRCCLERLSRKAKLTVVYSSPDFLANNQKFGGCQNGYHPEQ